MIALLVKSLWLLLITLLFDEFSHQLDDIDQIRMQLLLAPSGFLELMHLQLAILRRDVVVVKRHFSPFIESLDL